MTDNCLTLLEYETRNLEMPCYAVSADFINNPDQKRLMADLATTDSYAKSMFAQARVLPDQFPALGAIEKSGFMFVETTLDPYTVLGKSTTLQTFLENKAAFIPKRINPDSLEFITMNPNDPAMCDSVKKIAAESFVKDRFHIDPHCPDFLADKRYVYWVEDLLRGQTTFHLLCYENNAIGFMARNGQHLVLAGFSKKYSASGLGDYLWLSTLENMLAEGLGQVNTRISVNNIPVLNLYVRLGFKFREPAAMFHYWRNPHI